MKLLDRSSRNACYNDGSKDNGSEGKPVALNARAESAAGQASPTPVRSTSGGGNRVAAVAALLPTVFLVGAGITLQAQRAIAGRLEKARYGANSGDAGRVADALCMQILGVPATPVSTTTHTAYSIRKGVTVREWNVVCRTAAGNYLLRINADTNHVYAINRIEGELSSEGGSEARASAGQPDEARMAATLSERLTDAASRRLSEREAERRARRYVGMLGTPVSGLRAVSHERRVNPSRSDAWHFTYARVLPGPGARLLKVSVNGQSGELESLWNPVATQE